MGKAKRKIRPSPPRYFWLDADGCWCCKNRNNCANCKFVKDMLKLYGLEKKRDKQQMLRSHKKELYD